MMQTLFKKLPLAIVVAMSLNACITINPSHSSGMTSAPVSQGNQSHVGYRPASSHWSDVAKIRQRAHELGQQVGEGKLTKVQAAQHLNNFRIQLVGHNEVDDAMYDVYRDAAVDSQRGIISQAQSKQFIISALKGWQQRWSSMNTKPANPAFTNFLMEAMELPPLK